MPSKLSAGPPPTSGQDDVTVRRAGGRHDPAAGVRGRPAASERPDGGPARARAGVQAAFERAVDRRRVRQPTGALAARQPSGSATSSATTARSSRRAPTWTSPTPTTSTPRRCTSSACWPAKMDAYELDKRYVRQDGALVWAHLAVSLVRTRGCAGLLPSRWCRTSPRASAWSGSARGCCGGSVEAEATAPARRRRPLQALADAALSHLALDDLLRELLGRVTAVLGVDNVGILLLDDDGQHADPAGGARVGGRGRRPGADPGGQGFVGRIAASRAPQIADVDALSAEDFEGAHPILRERLRSLAGVPLLVEEQRGGRPAGDAGWWGCSTSAAPRRAASPRPTCSCCSWSATASPWRSTVPGSTPPSRTPGSARRRRWPGRAASEAQATARAAAAAHHPGDHRRRGGRLRRGGPPRPDQSRLPRAARRWIARRQVRDRCRPPSGRRSSRLRDATTGAPLPLERDPIARALRGEVVTGPERGRPRADVRRPRAGGERQRRPAARPGADGRIVGAVSVVRDVT